MLVVNYNGNKPIANYFKYGVVGNNNTDIVRFVLSKQQGAIDLTNAESIKVEVQTSDGDFIGEYDISHSEEKENTLFIDWVIGNLGERSVEIALSFKGSNTTWQTQLFTLKLMNSVISEED